MKKESKQAPTATDIPANLSVSDFLKELNTAKSKTDLDGWTGSLTFHLDKEPVNSSNKKCR